MLAYHSYPVSTVVAVGGRGNVAFVSARTPAQLARPWRLKALRNSIEESKGSMATKNKEEAKAGTTHYTSYLQVLATDIPFTSPSVLLIFNKERYLFNSGEGLQRIFREFKLRISKVDDFIFTRVTTETLGGLPGMLLSTDPASTAGGLLGPQVKHTVHGPKGIEAYVSAFRPYVNQDVGYQVKEFGGNKEPIIKTNFITITPVPITACSRSSPVLPSPAAPASPKTSAAKPASPSREAAVAPTPPNSSRAPAPSSPAAEAETLGLPLSTLAAETASTVQANSSATGVDSLKRTAEDAELSASAGGSVSAAAAVRKGEGVVAAKKQKLASSPIQARSSPPPPSASPVALSCSFVCELAGRPGKFDPKKAIALGITPGRLFGELQKGGAVPGPGGRLIQSSEVMSPSVPGPLVIVVDLPSEHHLAAAVEQAPFDQWSEDEAASTSGQVGGASPRLRVMVHLGPAAMLQGPSYRAWLNGLKGSWQHLLVSCGSCQASPIPRAVALQAHLNCLSDAVFPLLHSHHRPPIHAAEEVAAQQAAAAASASALAGPSVIVSPSLLKFNLTTTKQKVAGISTTEVLRESSPAHMQADFRAKHATLLAEAAAAAAECGGEELPAALQGVSRDTAEVLFLGTASSQPGKFRNVTGAYLDLFTAGGLLVDCGEDSLGQLVRRYGEGGALQRVLQLRVAWVSHMHADHHTGLYRMLELRRLHLGEAAPALLIIGPMPLFRVLNAYKEVVPFSFRFLPSLHFQSSSPAQRAPPAQILAAYEAAKRAMGLARLEPFEVAHVANSSGLIVEGTSGWRIVFSADTRPCQQVIDAARGATLLVHEATFEDEMSAEAIAKKHSTTSEALGVAEKAGVYRTVLTHFSTRYPTLPKMPPNHNMAVALDFMRCNLADLHWLPRLVAPLGVLFEAQSAAWKADAADDVEVTVEV